MALSESFAVCFGYPKVNLPAFLAPVSAGQAMLAVEAALLSQSKHSIGCPSDKSKYYPVVRDTIIPPPRFRPTTALENKAKQAG